MSQDNPIVDEIRARLADDPRIPHPAEMAISEQGGTVTLRGTVGSFRQRHSAVLIAKSVWGVRTVIDELRMDPRDRWEDDEIRGAALQALIANVDVPAERIHVSVANGWVTLKGEVKHQSQSDAAFETVCELPGVGGVTNRIVVITAGIGE
jgi:osmotically-inducible protein OsmY